MKPTMMSPTPAPIPRQVRLGAIIAGSLSFVALYALFSLAMLFALAAFSERVASPVLYSGFKFIGLISWAVPGYVAARIAGQRGWLHGALTGLCVGTLVVLSMILTFSWEGTVHDAVVSSMFKTFVLASCLCTLGGGLVDLLAARRRRNQTVA